MLHNLYRERDQYNNLINSLRGAISSLSEGKGNIDDAAKLVSYYTVDDNPTDNGAFSSSADEISNMIQKLQIDFDKYFGKMLNIKYLYFEVVL